MKRKLIVIIAILLVIAAIVGGFYAYHIYKNMYTSNVIIPDKGEVHLYLPSNASYSELTDSLLALNVLQDADGFQWLAGKKSLPETFSSGHYILRDGMSNNEIINTIRAGRQVPVKVVFHNVRTVEELAGIISGQLELDSAGMASLLNDNNYISSLGYTKETIPALFIPNTYEFYWTTNAEEFISRMQKEHDRFWNESRMEKAVRAGLSPIEISTLASIIDEETSKNDEKSKIAGVYINRLKRGIPLQADPTIKFALGDPTIKRVLSSYLTIDSPYNTYKNAGLPPGPIRIPSIAAMEAVMNYQKHEYLYFCAKADFSGYHAFAKTLTQHLRNAKKYQQALNKKRIYR